MNAPMYQREGAIPPRLPACLDAERAARFFGWPTYYITLLMRARHLKPLGKPSQNSRKWFAAVELEQLALDRAWLDKAIVHVAREVREANALQREPRNESGSEQRRDMIDDEQSTVARQSK
jgi:hypothetical protein